MFYDTGVLLDVAKPIGDGFKRADVTLVEGDTAMAPGTTKKVLKGVGKLSYVFYPDGMVTVDDPEGLFTAVSRRFIVE